MPPARRRGLPGALHEHPHRQGGEQLVELGVLREVDVLADERAHRKAAVTIGGWTGGVLDADRRLGLRDSDSGDTARIARVELEEELVAGAFDDACGLEGLARLENDMIEGAFGVSRGNFGRHE